MTWRSITCERSSASSSPPGFTTSSSWAPRARPSPELEPGLRDLEHSAILTTCMGYPRTASLRE
eukprot:6819382-Prorocentrum_lima.AAC.1